MKDKEELVINVLLADRLTCRNEIEKKLNDILTINSIFLGVVVAAFAYSYDKNTDILFIALPLFIFGWLWMIYYDFHLFYMNSKLICKIEDEINAILERSIMNRENLCVEYHKKHSYYNKSTTLVIMLPLLVIYGYSIYRDAHYLSNRLLLGFWPIFLVLGLVGILGIIFIIYLIYRNIYSISEDDSKFLDEFLERRSKKYNILPKILDKSEDNDSKYRKP